MGETRTYARANTHKPNVPAAPQLASPAYVRDGVDHSPVQQRYSLVVEYLICVVVGWVG